MEGQQQMTLSGVVVPWKATDKVGGSLLDKKLLDINKMPFKYLKLFSCHVGGIPLEKSQKVKEI
jgi:hypothetical protein